MMEGTKDSISDMSPKDALVHGMDIGNDMAGGIDWRNIMVWMTCIAMVALIVYIIFNIQLLKMDPAEYCNKAMNTSKCMYSCMP